MSAELKGRLTPNGVLIGQLNTTGGSGTDNYNDLVNKPSINGVTLAGNKTLTDLGINIPTKVSQLQNDSHYVQQSAIPTKTSQLQNDSGFAYAANLATVATTGSYNNLTDKPTIPAAQVNSDWNSNSGVSQILNKPNLAAIATSGSYDDLTNKPTIPAAQVNSDWNSNSGVSQILNKPTLAAVATSGSYDDLTDKPTIPVAQVNSDWNSTSGVSEILNKPTLAAVATSGSYTDLTNKPNLAAVATSGSYNDLTNKPTIPAAQVNSDWNSSGGKSQILNKPTVSDVKSLITWNETLASGTGAYKYDNLLFLSYQGAAATHTANDVLAVLPEGLRPIQNWQAVFSENGATYGVIAINSNSGNISINWINDNTQSGRIYFSVAFPIA